MEKQTLTAEVRTLRGKGPARQLRMSGKIPAVLYGPGGETVAISVDPDVLTKALTSGYKRNQLLELEVNGKKELAVTKELDVHPITRAIRHADFYRVALDRPVETSVPLHTKGKARGVGRGGSLKVNYRELPIRATPDKVPSEILVNVENVDMLETVRVKDLVLPEGVEVVMPPEKAVLMVTGERKKAAAEEEETPAAAGKKK